MDIHKKEQLRSDFVTYFERRPFFDGVACSRCRTFARALAALATIATTVAALATLVTLASATSATVAAIASFAALAAPLTAFTAVAPGPAAVAAPARATRDIGDPSPFGRPIYGRAHLVLSIGLSDPAQDAD